MCAGQYTLTVEEQYDGVQVTSPRRDQPLYVSFPSQCMTPTRCPAPVGAGHIHHADVAHVHMGQVRAEGNQHVDGHGPRRVFERAARAVGRVIQERLGQGVCCLLSPSK